MIRPAPAGISTSATPGGFSCRSYITTAPHFATTGAWLNSDQSVSLARSSVLPPSTAGPARPDFRILLSASELGEPAVERAGLFLGNPVVAEDREELVAEAPTDHARVVAVAEDERIVVRREALPCRRVLEVEPERAPEERGLVENDDPHLVGQVEVGARVGLRVRAHRVAAEVLDHPVPRPDEAARHHEGAEGVRQVAEHLQAPPVEEHVAAAQRELPPSEARDMAIDHLSAGADRKHERVEIRRIGAPGAKLVPHGLGEREHNRSPRLDARAVPAPTRRRHAPALTAGSPRLSTVLWSVEARR